MIFDISFDEAGVPDEAHQNDSYLLLRRLVILRQTSRSFIGGKHVLDKLIILSCTGKKNLEPLLHS